MTPELRNSVIEHNKHIAREFYYLMLDWHGLGLEDIDKRWEDLITRWGHPYLVVTKYGVGLSFPRSQDDQGLYVSDEGCGYEFVGAFDNNLVPEEPAVHKEAVDFA